MVNVGVWGLWIVVLVNALLGIVVFTENRTAITRIFLFFTLACAGWAASNALFVTVPTDMRFLVALVSYSVAASLGFLFYIFCKALVSGAATWGVREKIIGAFGLAVVILSGLPGIVGQEVTDDLRIITNLPMLVLYGLFLLAFFGMGLVILLKVSAGKHDVVLKTRARIMLVGLSIAVLVGIICNLLLPLIGVYEFVQFGPLGSIFLVLSSAYGIVKHGLFDIRQEMPLI
jgi:hypothetical protein